MAREEKEEADRKAAEGTRDFIHTQSTYSLFIF